MEVICRSSTSSSKKKKKHSKSKQKKEPSVKSPSTKSSYSTSVSTSLKSGPSNFSSLEQAFSKVVSEGNETPFEIDAPREVLTPCSNTGRPSTASNFSNISQSMRDLNLLGEHLENNKNGWAGIDALLDSQSVNDRSVLSTSDILPSETVKELRRNVLSISPNEMVAEQDESDIKGEIGRSINFTPKKKTKSKKRKTNLSALPSLKETSEPRKDKYASHTSRANGNLFDMFVWSDKDNVDNLRNQKKKLNQTRKFNNHRNSDDLSLPSLASLRENDFIPQSRKSGFYSLSNEQSSVVTEDNPNFEKRNTTTKEEKTLSKSEGSNICSTSVISMGTIGGSNINSNLVIEDCLVLDKEVDDYINKIRQELPTAESNKMTSFYPKFEKMSATQSCITKEHLQSEDLPSFMPSRNITVQPDPARRGFQREVKKERKHPISSLLLKSMKRISAPKTPKPPQRGTVNGNDEKYFPDNEKSKLFSSSRGLLHAGGEA